MFKITGKVDLQMFNKTTKPNTNNAILKYQK